MPQLLLQPFLSLPLSLRYMLLSALGFALMSACVKLVSQYNIPVLEIVAFRAIISLVLSYWAVRRKQLSIWGNHKLWLIARGVVGALALICVYYAITTLPLAEATILQYLHPVFTAILATLFLKERIQLSTMVCIILSLIGLLFIVQPSALFTSNLLGNMAQTSPISLPPFSILAALTGALGSAIAYVIVKKLSTSEDPAVIIFYFPLIALPLSICLLGNNFIMPNAEAFTLLIFVGVFTQVGQIGLTKAMQTEDASKATAFSYIQVVFSIILGWFVFAEIPSIFTCLGGALIISGSLVNVLLKR